MVQQFYSDDLAGLCKPLGDASIFGTGGRVAAGMVVCDNQGGGACGDSVFEDFARVNETAVQNADRDGMHADHLVLRVQKERSKIKCTFSN